LPQSNDPVTHNVQPDKIPIGISSCLLGERVRFDSGHKQNAYIIKTLGQFFDFKPFCPEVSIGLGIPREPIRLIKAGETIRCVGTKSSDLDVTEALTHCADEQRHWHSELCGYIVKKDSPSCGMERVRVYHKDQPERVGVGIYAQQLMQNHPHMPVEEEGRLGDPVIRENFIQRVFALRRWQTLLKQPISWHGLTAFHAQHKLILMSHNQDQARRLGKMLSQSSPDQVHHFAATYVAEFMSILESRQCLTTHTRLSKKTLRQRR